MASASFISKSFSLPSLRNCTKIQEIIFDLDYVTEDLLDVYFEEGMEHEMYPYTNMGLKIYLYRTHKGVKIYQ